MCERCQIRAKLLMADIKIATMPNPPADQVPWKPAPYPVEARAEGVRQLKEFYLLALWNAWHELGLPMNSDVIARATKRMIAASASVLEGLPDVEVGRLVFFQAAYEAAMGMDRDAFELSERTRNAKNYFRMPEGFGAEILSLFPSQDILMVLAENIMPGVSKELNLPKPPEERKFRAPRLTALVQKIIDTPVTRRKANPNVEDLGGGMKMASFDSIEDLFNFIEREMGDPSTKPVRPTD